MAAPGHFVPGVSRPPTSFSPPKQDVGARHKATGVRHGLCLMECTALILLGFSWLRIIWTREEIKAVHHQNIVFHGLLKQIPWSVVDRLVGEYGADCDPRGLKTKAHLIAMLYAQLCGGRG